MYVRILKNSNSITESLAQTIQHSFLVQVTQISNKVQSESKPLSYLTCLCVSTKTRRKPLVRSVTVHKETDFPGRSAVGQNGSHLLCSKGSVYFYWFAVGNSSYLTIYQKSKVRFLVQLQ